MTALVTTYSPLACAVRCLAIDGCLAINMLGDPNRCELTSGVINIDDVVEDNSSDIYVLGGYPWLPKLIAESVIIFEQRVITEIN